MQLLLCAVIALLFAVEPVDAGWYWWQRIKHGGSYFFWENKNCWDLYPNLRDLSVHNVGTYGRSWGKHGYICAYRQCHWGHGPAYGADPCTACNYDHYNRNPTNACQKCPSGKYISYRGAQTVSECKNCQTPCNQCSRSATYCTACASPYRSGGPYHQGGCVCDIYHKGLAPGCSNRPCPKGFTANGKRDQCNVDVNECSWDVRSQDRHACDITKSTCHNEYGRYLCKCNVGYHYGNGRKLGTHQEVCVPEPVSVEATASSTSILVDTTFNVGTYGKFRVSLKMYTPDGQGLLDIDPDTYVGKMTTGLMYHFEDLSPGKKYQVTVQAIACPQTDDFTAWTDHTSCSGDIAGADSRRSIDIETTCGCRHNLPTKTSSTFDSGSTSFVTTTWRAGGFGNLCTDNNINTRCGSAYVWHSNAALNRIPVIYLDLGLQFAVKAISATGPGPAVRIRPMLQTLKVQIDVSKSLNRQEGAANEYQRCATQTFPDLDRETFTAIKAVCGSELVGRYITIQDVSKNADLQSMQFGEIANLPVTCDSFQVIDGAMAYGETVESFPYSEVNQAKQRCQELGLYGTGDLATGCTAVYCNSAVGCQLVNDVHYSTSILPWATANLQMYKCHSKSIFLDSGSPIEFVPTQKQGWMEFSWVDDSKCEDSFSLFRRGSVGGSDKISFTEDYAYTSQQQCGISHQPGFVRQDLRLLMSSVGQYVEFCIQSVQTIRGGQKYSDPTCSASKIQYEASISGMVQLPVTAGSLPVRDVSITWKFVDLDTIGETVKTDVEGRYEIYVMTEDITEIFPIIDLAVFKQSGNVQHEFKCDDYNFCSNKPRKLEHLTFDTVQNFEDHTSVEFSGSVFIKGTESSYQPNGCPLVDAKVCLVGFEDNTEYACGTSDINGNYQLPATIGTTVKAVVTYNKYPNHVFKKIGAVDLVSDGENAVEKFVVEADSVFQRMHYQDTTTRPLKIEVCLGKCNLYLGTAEVVVRHATCEKWSTSFSIGEDGGSTFEYFDVPAHDLLVGFTKVDDEGEQLHDVYDYFTKIYGQGAYKEIDLRIIPDEADEKYEDAADETAQDVGADTGRDVPEDSEDEPIDPYVRFEFHPQPEAHVTFVGPSSTSVINHDCDPNDPDRDPGLAIKQRTDVEATVFVVEPFQLKSQRIGCNHVDASVYLVNLLGESAQWGVDQKAKGTNEYTEAQIDMLTKCANVSAACQQELSYFKKPEKAELATASIQSYLLNRNGDGCMDSDYTTTCATHPADNPWLLIDLGSIQQVDHIIVHPCRNGVSQVECIHENLHSFEIWLLESDSIVFEKNGKRCYSGAGHEKDERQVESAEGNEEEDEMDGKTQEDNLNAKCEGQSQYVLIRRVGKNVQLEFSEVEVYVREPHVLGSQYAMNLTVADPETSAGAVDAQNPYTKLFQVIVPVQGYTATNLQRKIVVIGDKVINKVGSVALPEYYPMTVVHDPPGGKSFASYKNVDVGMNVNLNTRDENYDMKIKPLIGIGVDADLLSCQAVQCTPFFTIELNYEHALAVKKAEEEEEKTKNTHTMTLSFSYDTSSNMAVPGRESDVFLIPAMNIIFEDVIEVSFNASTCMGNAKEKMQWSYDADGESVISYVTEWDITYREKPVLDRMLAQEQEVKDVCDTADQEQYTEEQCAENINKLEQAQGGVDGWAKVLQRQENAYAQASAGTLTTVNHLLDRKSEDKELAPDLMLAPWDLVKNVEGLHSDTQENGATVELLRQVESLKFSGGGAGTDYSITEENYNTIEYGFGSRGHIAGEGKLALAFNIFVVKLRLGVEFDVKYELKSMQRISFRKDVSSSIGFHLADEDFGDAFTLDVYIDPYYGTFVFNAVGGYSSCPAEKGFAAREVFDLNVIERPLVAVNHDQTAKFVLEVSNLGDPTDLVLYTYDWVNPFGLEMELNGDPAYNEILLENAPEGKMNVTLTISRGPVEYDYTDIRFFVGSLCERSRFMEGHGGRIAWTNLQTARTQWAIAETSFDVEFQRPCPAVQLSGALAELKTFKVNSHTMKKLNGDELHLVALNPNVESDGKWQHSKDNHNLQTVQAEYRVAGDNVWRPCLDRNSEIIDFIADERDNGMSAGRWHLGPMPDGEYEIRLSTKCLTSTLEPVLGMDYQISESARGIMDRVAPVQFGMTEPADGSYFPGDLIGVEFNEDIDCNFPYYFDVTLTVHSMYDEDVSVDFDSRDMVVRCERRKLNVGFKASIPYNDVMGKKAALLVHNVMDMQGNPMIADIKHSFSFSVINVNDAAVYVDRMQILVPWTESYQDTHTAKDTALVDGLQMELAALLDCEAGRIHIQEVQPGENDEETGDATVDVSWIMEGAIDEGSFTSTFLVNFLQSILQNDNLEHFTTDGQWVSKIRRTYLNTLLVVGAADEARRESQRSYSDLVDEQLCSMVQFDGSTAEEGAFEFNLDSAGNGKSVRLHYSNPVPGRSWASNPRLERVECEYKMDGQVTWEVCKGEDGNDLVLFNPDSSNYVAHVDWDVSSLPDQSYQVRLHAICDDQNMTVVTLGNVGVDEAFSAVISGTIDRTPPQAESPSSDYFPGQPLVFKFYEDIICGNSAEAILSVLGEAYRDSNVQVTCEKNQVIVDFDLMEDVQYSSLLGQTATVRLIGIEDKLHNRMSSLTHSFRFSQVALEEASVSVHGMFFPLFYPTDPEELAATKGEIATELAAATGVDESRFTVTGMIENSGSGTTSLVSLGGLNANFIIEAGTPTASDLVFALVADNPDAKGMQSIMLPSSADKRSAVMATLSKHSQQHVLNRQMNTQSVVDALPEAPLSASPASMMHMYRTQIRICVSLVFVASVLYHFGAQLRKMMGKKA